MLELTQRSRIVFESDPLVNAAEAHVGKRARDRLIETQEEGESQRQEEVETRLARREWTFRKLACFVSENPKLRIKDR